MSLFGKSKEIATKNLREDLKKSLVESGVRKREATQLVREALNINTNKSKKIAKELSPQEAEKRVKNFLLGINLIQDKTPSKKNLLLGIQSSAIKRVAHDPKKNVAFVQFRQGGKNYAFPNITEDNMRKWMLAGSKGKYFWSNVKEHAQKNFRAREPKRVSLVMER